MTKETPLKHIADHLNELDIMSLRRVSQVALIQYMVKSKIIDSAEDYTAKGYAEAFDLLAEGTLRCNGDVDWDLIRNELSKVVKKIIP